MSGLEFIVAYDPLQAAAQSDTRFAHEPSNIWVIRKQNRRKRNGMDDEVTVISTYFVVGDSIYMAPSVASVVGNRILSAVTSLSRLMKTASTLPTFTPSYGHTYLPPATKTDAGPQASQQSKESTPMPDAAPPSTAETQTSSKAGLGVSTSSSNYKDIRSLAESFNLFTRYGDEFMDENPLVGEPGSFILSRTGEKDRATKNAAKSAPARPRSTSPSAAPARVATPQVRVDTPGKLSEKTNSPTSSGRTRSNERKAGLQADVVYPISNSVERTRH
ncbi:hypothetical protein N7470_007693 [Penicillium chermesinum]|nr:hypothetical protein N7470_007693 [Penicillium chermesinum]